MSNDNKEFFDLLNSIVDEQTFSLELCPREEAKTVSCKQLSTAQLKELIKTVVDSPLTQAVFNSTATKIFNQSLVEDPLVHLNVIDRLLFLLETRINSLSPTRTIQDDNVTFVINFKEILAKLKQQLKDNASLFEPSSASEGKITINFGVALLDCETQLNEEFYKNINLSVEDADELRILLGEAFINEIAKSVRSITIEDKTLELSLVTFEARLKAIELIPASLIEKVIEYIEKYKKIVDESLIVDDYSIVVDGSLFSLR